MQIKINDDIYDVEIIRKNNRNTYIRVKNGKIVVTTNYFATTGSITKLINNNIASITKMINIDNKKQNKKDDFYYFGKKYDVIYGFDNVEFSGDKIFAKDKRQLDKYIYELIKKTYEERLYYWYNKFTENIPVPNLKIRKMTSRWGVCNTRNHNVTLNYELAKYDPFCLDYVIVHELSHFIYHDHQKGFWSLVSKYYPQYKEARKMLKE